MAKKYKKTDKYIEKMHNKAYTIALKIVKNRKKNCKKCSLTIGSVV